MGNIFSILQEIFMLKEDDRAKVGLSSFKENATYTEKTVRKNIQPKELKISDLMRKNSYASE